MKKKQTVSVTMESKKCGYSAHGEYNIATNELTVKKGSIISDSISDSKAFKSKASIKKQREGVIENNILIKDITFRSSSSAANFVTGHSKNGLTMWKTKDGTKLFDLLHEVKQ